MQPRSKADAGMAPSLDVRGVRSRHGDV